MNIRRFGIPATGILAILILAGPLPAVDIIDDPVQLDERAGQLIQASNSLCWEMHRFHQQQPEFRQSYRAAKEIWSRARDMKSALRSGPVESEVLAQQATEINDILTQLDKSLSKWGNGDQSAAPQNGEPRQRVIVTPGAEIDVPFVGGIRVGNPQVIVTDDEFPPIQRRRLHPNSRGSQRSLERELAAVKVAMEYLLEDAGVTKPSNVPAAADSVPEPPAPNSTSGNSPKATTPGIVPNRR